MWRASRDGDWHEAVECAVGADGEAPAVAFLDALASGEWADDPEHDPPGDLEQIHDHAMLLAKIEFVGRHGQPEHGGDVKDLRNGIWEFRHGKRRLTYWDTPGDGTWVPKPRHRDISERTTDVDDGFWWYPDLDLFLRLGCAWPKEGQKAPQDKIDEAERLREEDCAHDRST